MNCKFVKKIYFFIKKRNNSLNLNMILYLMYVLLIYCFASYAYELIIMTEKEYEKNCGEK